ncbi:MAG TPA: ATP synthase F0 subunit B [Blastocatellia bacterium]
MTMQHFSFALLVPALPDIHPLLLSGGFWTSPTGFPKLVNLVVFLTILYLLLRKPTREFFHRRLTSVRETLDRAAEEKKRAAAMMADLDARLNRLDADLREISAQSERDVAAERARMEAETKRDIEKIRQTAAREVDAAKQVALADLRAFAAASAVELAEQIIRREMTPGDDAKLVARVGEELIKVK